MPTTLFEVKRNTPVPRIGLLKDYIFQYELNMLLEQMEDLDERNNFRKSLEDFSTNEESLMEPHKGEYAAFFNGECVAIAEDRDFVIKSVYERFGYHALYCDRIGGEPHYDVQGY